MPSGTQNPLPGWEVNWNPVGSKLDPDCKLNPLYNERVCSSPLSPCTCARTCVYACVCMCIWTGAILCAYADAHSTDRGAYMSWASARQCTSKNACYRLQNHPLTYTHTYPSPQTPTPTLTHRHAHSPTHTQTHPPHTYAHKPTHKNTHSHAHARTHKYTRRAHTHAHKHTHKHTHRALAKARPTDSPKARLETVRHSLPRLQVSRGAGF
jgi:hypothetical protein